MIVKMYQLSFHVFKCAFHPEISSFFRKSFLFFSLLLLLLLLSLWLLLLLSLLIPSSSHYLYVLLNDWNGTIPEVLGSLDDTE